MVVGDSIPATVVHARSDGLYRVYPVDPARDACDYVFPIGTVTPSDPAVRPQ